jgi:hypothetical protein
LIEPCFVADQGQTLGLRLRDQHAVEGVAVLARQGSGLERSAWEAVAGVRLQMNFRTGGIMIPCSIRRLGRYSDPRTEP